MYIPQSFSEQDLGRIHWLMRAYGFATLITTAGGLQLSHLPFLLDPTRGPYGTLRGHLARGNPQWRALARADEVLVLFQGPHTYVSPSWYETPVSVPTWNYSNVYAYGIPHLLQDDQGLLRLLRDLVHTHEQRFDPPWRMNLPADYLHQMMGGIVGFEIAISRVFGKFKLSQNRSAADRRRVIHALEYLNEPGGTAIAALMKTLPDAESQ